MILKNNILNNNECVIEYIIKIKEFDRWHSSKLIKMENSSEYMTNDELGRINISNIKKKSLNDIYKTAEHL